MKKLLFLGLALTISVASFSQFAFKGVGGGLSLGSKTAYNTSGNSAMGFGINVNALAGIMDKIDADANFTFFFPSEPVTGLKLSVIGINVNGRYNFYQDGGITAYGLAGLNYSISSVTMSFMGTSVSSSGSDFGLNIGAGGAYEINKNLDATAQIGYTAGGINQLFINLGVLYKF
jgi:hypothetical protein